MEGSGRGHFDLTYLPLLIRLKCCEAANLPDFLGSTLHGVMGWTLLPYREIYHYIFENHYLDSQLDVPNPYVIEPPAPKMRYEIGDELRFQILLIGDSVHYASDIIKALAERKSFGLGADRKRFELSEIMNGQTLSVLWSSEHDNVENLQQQVRNIVHENQRMMGRCSIQLMTPLRIRRKGELVLNIDFSTLIRNITRRIQELTARYGGWVDEWEIQQLQATASDVVITSSGVSLYEIRRFSTRKNKKIEWNGLMGAMTFEGDLAPFLPWLHAAGILHLGRNTTLGYGKIDCTFW